MTTSLKNRLETPGARLKYLRAILHLTRAYIEKQYKLPEITLKSWENGTIKLSKNGVKRCVNVYRSEGLIVDEGWIAEGKGLDPTIRLSVGHYFSTPSDATLPIEEDDEVAMMRDANVFRSHYPNAVVLIVSNDEMSPYYVPGDYVGGRMRSVNELDSVVDRDCIIYLKDGAQYFRRVFRDNFGRYNLACLNPAGTTSEPVLFNAEIESVAPVCWIRKKDE